MNLEKKIIALVVFFGILVSCLFLYLNQSIFGRWVSNERYKHARYVASEITSTAGRYVLTGDVFGLQHYIDRLMRLEQEAGRSDLAYLFVQGEDGNILAHTFGDSFPTALKSANTVRPGEGERSLWLKTEEGVIFDLAVPLQKKGGLGTVRLGLSYAAIAKNIRNITVFVIFTVLFIVLLASVVVVFLIRRWLDPISILGRAFGHVKEGDFSQRVNIRGQGELSRLARDFNAMVTRLQETTVSKSELEKAVVSLESEVAARKKAEDILRQNYLIQSSLNSFLRLSLEDLKFEDIFDAALDILFRIPLFSLEPKGAIFLAEGHHLVMKAQKNLSAYLLKECAVMPFGKCLCGKAALTKKVQFVNALEDSHEVLYDGIKPHGHYCVPILFGEELLGVLNMYIPAQQPYDPKAEEFLKAVTNVFANMIVRKRAEVALKKSETNLSLAQHLAKMGSWEWRSDTDEFFWSKEACSVFEREAGQMPKNMGGLLNFIHAEDREKFKSFYQKIIAEQKNLFSSEFRIVASSGKEHFVRAEGTLTKRKESEGALELAGTICDMTFQKEIEKSQRLVQLGVLVARVAHEVNNPLMVVSGHAQLALLEDIKDSGLKRDLEVIVKECDRAKYIIQRLLNFSKPPKAEDEEFDINEAINEIVLLLEHQYSLENVSIKRSYGSGLPRLKTDKKGLQEVVSNLLNNAQDAIEDKGSIEITTSLQEGLLKIDIRDTGKGMSEEVASKIFDPFFSTKPMGTGLGLSVSYSIIKGLGGDLTFKSAPNQGTTATIAIPVEKS
jgi:signal transduction histidine kinase